MAILFGIFVGLFAILVSIGLAFWNENRVDVSRIAGSAVELTSDARTADEPLQGTLVSVSGSVTSNEMLGDDLFLLPGNYLAVRRIVEMYAWVENNPPGIESTDRRKRNPTTSYQKTWTSNPRSEVEFQFPLGHDNPPFTLASDNFVVSRLQVGAYSMQGDIALPPVARLSLNDEALSLTKGAVLTNDEYIFIGNGSLSNPELGDVRVRYEVLLPDFDGTVFGAFEGGEIHPYVDENGNELYRLFSGSHEQAVATLQEEYAMMTWIIRLIGFIFMGFGIVAGATSFAALLRRRAKNK